MIFDTDNIKNNIFNQYLRILSSKIKNRIWSHVNRFFYYQRLNDNPIAQNLNYTFAQRQKKALICYLTITTSFYWDNNTNGRTQPFEILSIANVFSELGYSIDIIDHNDVTAVTYINTKKYDIILGFGEAFYQMAKLQPQATSILYMTEHHPEFSFQEEKKRLEYFYSRHGRQAEFTRSGAFYKLSHLNETYSHVITMSEIGPFLSQYKKPYDIFPTGIINPSFTFSDKDHQSAKKNFLWLGSTGAIHKGLDLLLDVFGKRDDVVLHFCGLLNQERHLLKPIKRKNIIEYSRVDIKSEQFLHLVNTCSYIILPSCSEGFSTSITTGMLHGLIPVVMKDTGFNRLGTLALFLDNYEIDYLNRKITELANESVSILEPLSKNAYEFAQKHFSVSSFEKSFKNIILDISDIND